VRHKVRCPHRKPLVAVALVPVRQDQLIGVCVLRAKGVTRIAANALLQSVFGRPAFRQTFDISDSFLPRDIHIPAARKMDEGELVIKKPVDKSVALHDSCHSRVMKKENIMDTNREFLKRIGVNVINTKNHHEEGFCCGVAAGCRRQMPHDIMLASYKQVRECKSTGADEMGIYCTGCYLMLNLTRNVFKSGQPMRHTLEYLAEALDEPKEYLAEQRTKKMLKNVIIKAVPTMLSPKRYFVEDIKIGEGMEDD